MEFSRKSHAKRFRSYAFLFEHPDAEPPNPRVLTISRMTEDECRERLACGTSKFVQQEFYLGAFEMVLALLFPYRRSRKYKKE